MEVAINSLAWLALLNIVYAGAAFLVFGFILLRTPFSKFPGLPLKSVFTGEYFFRSFRYSLLVVAMFLVKGHYNIYNSHGSYKDYEFVCGLTHNFFQNCIQLYLVLIVLSVLVYRIFKRSVAGFLDMRLSARVQEDTFVLTRFLGFVITSFSLFLFTLWLAYLVVFHTDNFLVNQELIPFEVLTPTGPSSDLVYKRGVYFAIVGATIVLLVVYNTLQKNLKENNSSLDRLLYLFVLVIMWFGIYCGLYAVINFALNYWFSGLEGEWFVKDKLLGHFAVRITAIILLLSISMFIFRTIFKGNGINLIIHGILPVSPSRDRKTPIGDLTGHNSNYYHNYYFVQVGFYIVAVFVAEFLIAMSDINVGATILFSLLPIMVDDYLVIHVYFEKYEEMYWWHKWKKVAFNVLLTLFCLFSLYLGKHSFMFGVFVVSCILLLSFYYFNEQRPKRANRW